MRERGREERETDRERIEGKNIHNSHLKGLTQFILEPNTNDYDLKTQT